MYREKAAGISKQLLTSKRLLTNSSILTLGQNGKLQWGKKKKNNKKKTGAVTYYSEGKKWLNVLSQSSELSGLYVIIGASGNA